MAGSVFGFSEIFEEERRGRTKNLGGTYEELTDSGYGLMVTGYWLLVSGYWRPEEDE